MKNFWWHMWLFIVHTDQNFADSVQYNSAYTNHPLLLIFNHKINNCELPDCVHMISAFTGIYPLLSYLNNIYKSCTLSDYDKSYGSSEIFNSWSSCDTYCRRINYQHFILNQLRICLTQHNFLWKWKLS
jgi:hypothetical protein